MARCRRRNAAPGIRPVGTIPGYATEIQYRRHGTTPYYHPFAQPRGGRVKMYTLNNGGVMLKGPSRIHADDREPGFDRFVSRAARARNPRRDESNTLELLIVALGVWWLWQRAAPAAGLTMGIAPGDVAGWEDYRAGERAAY